MNNVKTEKGTVLPLISLKGKPYMMVAHRIVWFNEEVKFYKIETEYLALTEDSARIKAVVTIFNEQGKILKSAPGTKCENKKDFPDFVEKAETGAVGRAITMLGYGTAYALADLDEGDRIIDAPVVDTRKTPPTQASVVAPVVPTASVTPPVETAKPAPSFRRNKPTNGAGTQAASVTKSSVSNEEWT